MVYLERFELPGEGAEEAFLRNSRENKRTCYTSRYPFGIFPGKRLTHLELEPVTLLCGGNGSGKTTLLNLMGEKLELRRGAVFNRSAFYGDYLRLCRAETAPAFGREERAASRVITSDDVFDWLLEQRQINEGIGRRRQELLEEYASAKYAHVRLRSLEDYDALKQSVDAKRLTASRYVRDRVMNDVPGKSNGESAFLYFTREVGERGLYLLDEPENSLSPRLQLELVRFLEDSVRFYGCQLVAATHSPFLLAMRGAKIYDLDRLPAAPCRWTQLEHVRTFYRFCRERSGEFEDEGPF